MPLPATLRWRCFDTDERARDTQAHTVVLIGGYAYVHGGYGRDFNALNRFCIINQTWEKLSGLKYRYSHTSVLAKDVIIVFGGAERNLRDLPIEVYDPVLDQAWDVLSGETFKSLRLGHPTGVYLEQREEVIILGGESITNVYGLNVETYRLKRYAPKGTVPSHRRGNSVTVFRDGLILFSNVSRETKLFVLTAWRKSFTWSTVRTNSLIREPLSFPVCHYLEGIVLSFGGCTSTAAVLYLIDILNGDVVKVDGMRHAGIEVEGTWPDHISRHASCFINGKMLVLGGGGSHGICELSFNFA